MSETLARISDKVARVSDLYARNCNIRRDDDWYLLKLQEELGELTAEVLRATGRGRGASAETRARIADEAGDLFAHLLLFVRHHDIDLEAALAAKWYGYLE